jgi:hypothetical protein
MFNRNVSQYSEYIEQTESASSKEDAFLAAFQYFLKCINIFAMLSTQF